MSGYLARVKAETSSRFWINNPTLDEATKAIAAGAVGCTTNPAYMAGLARRTPAEIVPIMQARINDSDDDREVADRVQLDLVVGMALLFEDIHHQSRGMLGYVSIQGGPETDDDPEIILNEALDARRAASNVIPKIPATVPGLAAMEELVGRGHPCIVTEVFSLAQLIAVCERHRAATHGSRHEAPLFISPITGIFSDYLRISAAESHATIDPAFIGRAGVVLGRACQQVMVDRGYRATLLAGGARQTADLTDLIGGGMHATINYSTVDELEALDPPVVETIGDRDAPGTIQALISAFDAVRIALDPAALAEADFASFPPVLYFRSVFTAGWTATLDTIAAERAAMSAFRTVR